MRNSHLAINAQHFGHLLSKVGIALFQVVSHFVRFHLFLVEDLAHCALGEVGEARMSLRGSMLASVAGQKPRCPQFVGIAKFLRLPARQRHQPCLGLGSDRRLSTGARAIIQRSQRAFGHSTLDAALDRLMMQPECPADRKKRGVFSIGQQDPRPLHPARRFSARMRYRSQLRRISFSKRQLNRPPPRCHDFSSRSLVGTRDICGKCRNQNKSPLMTSDSGIDSLIYRLCNATPGSTGSKTRSCFQSFGLSDTNAFRTFDWEIPNCRAIRVGVMPALKAARTAFT